MNKYDPLPEPDAQEDVYRGLLRQRMVRRLATLAPEEGYNLTSLPDVRFLRSNRPLKATPVLYDPGIVIVCQGRKRGYFGDRVYVYDDQHYLAVSVPVPFTMETDASADEPLLAIYMHLDFELVADLMLELAQHGSAGDDAPSGMMSTPMDATMAATVLRFLDVMSDPLQADILGRALVREIYFHVLAGAQGGAMRAAMSMQGRFGKIARAIRCIHQSYASGLTVEELAKESGMSVPSFHAHFRNVTNTSPMQYLKSTRLHQARLLMLRNGMTAAAASYAVGYGGPTQFSREFKRLFGRSPGDEVKRMKAEFAIPPAQANPVFVSSH